MCKKCMGSSGYFVEKKVTYGQEYDWNNEPTDAFDIKTDVGKIGQCLNCGYRLFIKKQAIQGVNK